MRMETKLMLFFIIMEAGAIGTVSYFYTESAGTALAQRTDAQLASVGMMKEEELDRYIRGESEDLQGFAKGLEWGQALEGSGMERLESWVKEAQAADREFGTLSIISLNGTVIASSDPALAGTDAGGEAWFVAGGTGTVVKGVFPSAETGQPAGYVIATPVRDSDGRPAAVLAGRIGFQAIDELMLEPVGLGASGEVFLVSREGVPLTALKKYMENPLSPIHTKAVEQCVAGRNGSARYTDYHGDDVIVRYSWLANRDVCIISKIDASEALSSTREMQTRVVLVSAALFVLALGTGFAVFRAVLAPIDELTEVVSSISKGRMNTDVSPALKESQDEIGRLARAFDRTLVSLKLAMKESAPELKMESRALKEALLERTKAEARYRALVQTSPDAVLVTDTKGIITEASGRTLSMFGARGRDEFVGKDAYDLLPARGREETRRALTKTLDEKGGVEGAKFTVQRKDGSTLTAEVNITRLKDAAGNHIGTIITLRDISRREAEDRALREALADRTRAEARYRTLLETSPDSVAATDINGVLTEVSDRTLRLHGYRSASELLGRSALELIAPEDRQRAAENTEKVAGGAALDSVHYRMLKKNGDIFIGELNARPLRGPDGKLIGFIATVRDATGREEKEAALRGALEEKQEAGKKLLRLNRLYSMALEVLHSRNPEKVMDDVCRIAVERGGLKAAWFGRVEPGAKTVKPVAHCGFGKAGPGQVSIAGSLAGAAIRSGKRVVVGDWLTEQRMRQEKETAVKAGCRSAAAFPLTDNGRAIGALSLWADEPGFFDDETRRLFEELAADVSFILRTTGKK